MVVGEKTEDSGGNGHRDPMRAQHCGGSREKNPGEGTGVMKSEGLVGSASSRSLVISLRAVTTGEDWS